jgi:hypothetical protein
MKCRGSKTDTSLEFIRGECVKNCFETPLGANETSFFKSN